MVFNNMQMRLKYRNLFLDSSEKSFFFFFFFHFFIAPKWVRKKKKTSLQERKIGSNLYVYLISEILIRF